MSPRRAYSVELTINGRAIEWVVIDDHYELKHSEVIDDDLILDLVALLNEKEFIPEKVAGDFEYFKSDPLNLNGLNYRLVWLLEKNQLYVGVINAFRR